MKANGAGPDMVAAASYTAVMVAVEGLRKTGGNGGSALRDAIAAGKFDMPTGMLSFNDLHEVAKDVQVQIVRDKAFHRHSIISDPVLLAPPTRTKK
jgi:branched-chain amino acid transport system substrate-binding protein